MPRPPASRVAWPPPAWQLACSRPAHAQQHALSVCRDCHWSALGPGNECTSHRSTHPSGNSGICNLWVAWKTSNVRFLLWSTASSSEKPPPVATAIVADMNFEVTSGCEQRQPASVRAACSVSGCLGPTRRAPERARNCAKPMIARNSQIRVYHLSCTVRHNRNIQCQSFAGAELCAKSRGH